MPGPIRHSQHAWDTLFMDLARRVALMSKDPDRKVGAVLVHPSRRQLSMGYNGLPADVPDLPDILADRDLKLRLTMHAERNCLEQSPFPAMGCTLYVTRPPCFDCAELICHSGVNRLVRPPKGPRSSHWWSSWVAAEHILHESGVTLVDFPLQGE